MNSVYVETASRIYAGLCQDEFWRSIPANAADLSFKLARPFMREYQRLNDEERADMQQIMAQHQGEQMVMGIDPLEIRNRPQI